MVNWQSKKQSVVSRSTAESELRAMANASCDLAWMHLLLSELMIPQSFPIVIYSDSQAALDIVADPVFHTKTKHFAIDCHFVMQQVQSCYNRSIFPVLNNWLMFSV